MTARPALESSVRINGCEIPNRLYRAPLLECAGTGPDAVETLVQELEPVAEGGVGLICQGATLIREEGGCAAPNMTRVHDPAVVSGFERLTDAVHEHGSRIFLQLEHGGLRSLETWHAGYRERHPDVKQLAVSRPPRLLRLLDRAGVLAYDPHVLDTEEVYDLAADFGRCAGYATDAGYDGIHLAGANMGIIQQFLSPYYNRRDDEFGGSLDARTRFLELLYEEIRTRVGPTVPIITKIPAETGAPRVVRRHLTLADGVELCERAQAIGFDAVVPVQGSVFWDMSLIRGAYPERAWTDSRFQAGYAAAFGGRLRARLVATMHRLHARSHSFAPVWNEPYCKTVAERVSIPVLVEGGIRNRSQIDRLLGEKAYSMVGMGRPFYAEPRLGARLLDPDHQDTTVVCESCNNCVVPQATGANGVCRTPSVLRKRGRYEQERAYE